MALRCGSRHGGLEAGGAKKILKSKGFLCMHFGLWKVGGCKSLLEASALAFQFPFHSLILHERGMDGQQVLTP